MIWQFEIHSQMGDNKISNSLWMNVTNYFWWNLTVFMHTYESNGIVHVVDKCQQFCANIFSLQSSASSYFAIRFGTKASWIRWRWSKLSLVRKKRLKHILYFQSRKKIWKWIQWCKMRWINEILHLFSTNFRSIKRKPRAFLAFLSQGMCRTFVFILHCIQWHAIKWFTIEIWIFVFVGATLPEKDKSLSLK